MELDSNVYNLLNVLLQVILWSLIVSAPFIILTIEMYAYDRYKKWKSTEVKEKEKIILGRSKTIVKQDEELIRQTDSIKRLSLDVELLEKRKKILLLETGEVKEPEVPKVEETTDLSKLSIRQLKAVAKERKLTMYSKKNKKQLLKMLEG